MDVMRELREVLVDLMAVDGVPDPVAVKTRVLKARMNLRRLMQGMELPTGKVVGLQAGEEANHG